MARAWPGLRLSSPVGPGRWPMEFLGPQRGLAFMQKQHQHPNGRERWDTIRPFPPPATTCAPRPTGRPRHWLSVTRCGRSILLSRPSTRIFFHLDARRASRARSAPLPPPRVPDCVHAPWTQPQIYAGNQGPDDATFASQDAGSGSASAGRPRRALYRLPKQLPDVV